MNNRISADPELTASVLRNGGVVGLPTETVYGLGAIALNQEAVMRVFAIKGRPTSHPLIVHLHPSSEVDKWGIFNKSALSLFENLCPGPLTLLVPRTSLVPDWVTGGRDTVAIRFPAHPSAIDVLQIVDTGVVAPSANKFGKVSPTTAQHVLQDLGEEVDVVLDGGACSIGVESTIVECIGDSIQVLRPGAISATTISEITHLEISLAEGESRAPGMLLTHYAPDAKILLVETPEEAETQLAMLQQQGNSVQLLFHADMNLYATTLYEELRKADLNDIEIVVALLPEPIGIGIAIRDRLHKAAASR